MLIGLVVMGVTLASICAALYTPDKSRAVLEAKYLDISDDIIEVAGTQLHVRDRGPRDRPVIILLHGFGSHLQSWDGWARVLEQDYRTIRFDLPGAGLSPPEATGDYTDTRAVALISALMDQFGIERATLIGNSLGGRIAWTFAANAPDRTDKLILVSPDGFASPGFDYDAPPEIPLILGAMKYTLPKWMLKSNLVLAYSDPAKLTPQTLQRYHDLMRAPGARDALIRRMKQTVLKAPEPLLATIQAPVLLIWGEDDAMIPISNAADYQAVLPDVRLVSLPGIGHLPQEEAAVQTIGPVLEFLRAQ